MEHAPKKYLPVSLIHAIEFAVMQAGRVYEKRVLCCGQHKDTERVFCSLLDKGWILF